MEILNAVYLLVGIVTGLSAAVLWVYRKRSQHWRKTHEIIEQSMKGFIGGLETVGLHISQGIASAIVDAKKDMEYNRRFTQLETDVHKITRLVEEGFASVHTRIDATLTEFAGARK